MRRPVLVLLVLLAVAASGCTDQGIVDRIARLEQADEELRDSLTDLGAPDPDAEQSRAAVLAELEEVAARITSVETDIEALRATMDEQGLELDDRLTTTELQLDEATVQLQELRTDLSTLTDRVSSLEAQFEAHQEEDHQSGLSSQDG